MYEKNNNIKQIRKIDKFRKIFILTTIALLLISSALSIVTSDTIYPYDLGDLEKTIDFQEEVYSIAFSQNNNWLSVGGDDKRVRIYKVSDWSFYKSISHPDEVSSVAFSPDNNWLAIGCWNHYVYVYNMSDWSLDQTLTYPTNVVRSIAFSPGSNWLAVGSQDNKVYVYNISNWSCNNLTHAASYVYGVAFSYDGNWLAAGSWDENVRIYKVSDWTLNQTLTNPTDAIYSVAFSQNNNWLAAGDYSSKIYIWKVSDWTLNKTLTDATSRIKSVAFSQNNNWLAAGSQDNNVRIYKVSDWTLNKTLTEATDIINSVAFSQNNNWLAAGGNDNQVRIYRGSLPIIRITNVSPVDRATGVSLNPTLNIQANHSSSSTINITWNTNESGSWVTFNTTTNVNNGTYSATNTSWVNSYKTDYWWNVSITDDQSNYSQQTFHFTTGGSPTVLTNASTGIEETNATLQGYIQEDGGESCTVRFEYGTTTGYGTNTSNQTKTTGNTFNTNIDSLTKGQLYHYRAYANNTAGSNTGSDKTFLTKPDAPSSFSATTQGSSWIDLTWTKGTGANKTHIRRKTGSYPNNVTDGTQIYNDTGTSYFDTGLSASTKYYYRAWSYTKWTYGSTTLHQWSDENDTDTSTTTSNGGGGGYTPPSILPTQDDGEESLTTKEQIEKLYNITLEYNFSATDTDRDGINDTFTDPNGILNAEHPITINEHASFLISVDGDLDKLFIWDTEADTITQVTHSIGTITGNVTDGKNITVIVNIEKTNWTYMEVADQYPNNDLQVKTSDGRTISSDMIWRKNNKIYVLDDPATEYLFIYRYEPEGFLFDVILELTKDSVTIGESINALITLINIAEPGLVNGTVIYNLSKDGSIIWSDEESVSVLGQKAFSKTISTKELSTGEYTYEVVYSYGDDQTASSSKTFTVNAQPPLEEIPLGVIVALMVVIIIVVIIAVLFKTGCLYLEEKGEGQEDTEAEKADKKTKGLDKKNK